MNAKQIFALSPIARDFDHKLMLKKQNIKYSAIPEKGTKMQIKGMVNQNCAAENEVIQNDIHPSIIDICRSIINRMDISLAGVDIITPDINQPLVDVGGVLNEVNTTPGLHHHYLVANRNVNSKDIGELILENLL